MKPGLMIIAILASVVAGAGGGYVATTMLAEKTPTPRTTVAANDFGSDPVNSTSGSDAEELVRIRQDVDILRARLEKAERTDSPDKALTDQIDKLNTRIAQLEKGGAVVAKSADGSPNPVALPDAELDARFDDYMERREAAEEARRAAEREERMTEMVQAGNKAILDRLSTDLALTEAQKNNITVVLDNYATARRDVFQRGGEAREQGVEFDWGTEMTTVHNAAADAVRNQLAGEQLSQFNELLGDRSLDRLAGGGRMGGQGGGPGGRRGNR
jgi:hypothetical protein